MEWVNRPTKEEEASGRKFYGKFSVQKPTLAFAFGDVCDTR